ncbi:MAG TPA: hypothetical protein VF161_09925 [Steroidobacteraceae bacterium]
MGKAVLLLLITSVSFALTSVHLVRQLRAERAQAAQLQARIEQLEKASRASAAPPATPADTTVFEPPSAQTPKEPTSEPPKPVGLISLAPPSGRLAPASALRSDEERARMLKEHMERQRALLKDPEYREAMLAQQKASLSRMYPDLAEEINLTDDEAERFATLLAEQQLRSMEMGMAWSTQPESPAEAEERLRRFREQEKANQAELEQLLGAQRYQAWKEYQETLGARYQVNELRSLFAAQGVPLQEELTKPLMSAMADEQRREMEEAARVFATSGRTQASVSSRGLVPMLGLDEGSAERLAQSQRRVREALSPYLTAEQLEVLEAEQETQLELHRASLRVMRKQAEMQRNAGSSVPYDASFFQIQAAQSQ